MVPHPTVRLWPALFLLFGTPLPAQTVIQWQNAANGSWFAGANWSGGNAPGNGRVAVGATGGSYVVSTSGASTNVTVAGLDLSSADARLVFDFTSTGYGVNLGNGTSAWTAGNVDVRTSYGIYGNGPANTNLAIGSGVELLYSTSTATRYLYNLTVANSGTIHATSGVLSINSATLTNDAGGVIHADGANINFSSGAATNNLGGIIHADGAEINFASNLVLTNLGVLRATGSTGVLYFGNSISTANLGTVELINGGHAYLAGALNNASSTLAAPTGGTFELHGGTINGGVIASGAVTFTNYGGYLSGATLNGGLDLPANASLRLTNGAGFAGSTATLGNSSLLYWQQSGTLAGKTVTFGNGSELYLADGNRTLTLDSATTLTGDILVDSDGSAGETIVNQGTINHTAASSGQIYARNLSNSGTITNSSANATFQIGSTSAGYTTSNTGTITVNATGASINLDGDFDNTGGTLNATNGSLVFRGDNTTAHLNGGTLNIATGAHAYLAGTINNSPATLNAPASGQYELRGGTITGGTIAGGALSFTNYGGYLDGATLNDNLTLPASAYVRLTNNAGFTGATVTLNDSSSLYWQQAGTLSGKAITFGTGSEIYVSGGNSTLTLGPATTATGDVRMISDGTASASILNQGTINHTSSSGGALYARSLTNSGSISNSAENTYLLIGSTSSGYNTTNTGTITVNATGASIYLDGNVDTSAGTLNATTGTLILRGDNSAAHLNGGTINIGAAGHVYLNGNLVVASLLNAPASGRFELYGGTITGGTVAPGALAFTSSGGYLDGTTLNDDLTLADSAYVRLANNTVFTGLNAALGSSSWLYWQQSGTLSGKTITFGNNSAIYLSGANHTLTIDANSTASGDVNIYSDGSDGAVLTNLGAITHTAASGGSLSVPLLTNAGVITNAAANSTLTIGSTYAGYRTNNTGNITVNAAGATVYLDGNVDNTGGTLNATNGQLMFRGDNITAHLNNGTINVSAGAHAYLNGTLDNTASTLSAPATGRYELYGGTINHGTVAAGALTFSGYGGTLNDVALLGNIDVPAGAYAYWMGGTNLATPSATLSLGANSGLYWKQSGTLTGTALTFGSNSYLYLSGANAALTLETDTTATGAVEIYADGSAGTSVTNRGTINHTTGYGYLGAETFTNNGTINATGGTLYLGASTTGATVANAPGATLRVNGGAISLQLLATNPLVNQGTIDIRSGTFYTSGRLTNGATGMVSGAGVVYGDLVVAGGILAPGNGGIGALSFSSGTLTVTGAATFAVDLGGTSSDQLVFQYPSGVVDIGSGLLALSVHLLSAPTANSTYNIITIASGSNGITGTFAGLAANGNTLTANFGGTDFVFSINYQPNFVSLAYNPVVVPEPSEYALLGVGLALVGWWRRNRRVRETR